MMCLDPFRVTAPAHKKLPSPAEVKPEAVKIATARESLRQIMEHSRGKKFSYPASFLPIDIRGILLAELREAGWEYKLERTKSGSDVFWIQPRETKAK